MEIDAGILAFLAFLVPILAQAVKVISAKVGWEVGRAQITIIAFVFSAIFAIFTAGAQLPPYAGDPIAYTGQLLQVAGVVYGLATVVYNIVLGKLFDAMGFTPDGVRRA